MKQHIKPRAHEADHVEETETGETDKGGNELADWYAQLTACVYESIKEIVPEKKWLKKNGRVVSETTKELFERRAKAFKRVTPTSEQRKKWNMKIRNACRNDYRGWVARWVETIESADNKGDTRTIYNGVKALGGSAAFERTMPTEHMTQKKHNLKTTNENESTAANGETETATVNQTTNKKSRKIKTVKKRGAVNKKEGKKATRGPRPKEDRHGHLGSDRATNKNAEPTVTDFAKAATNENLRNAAKTPAEGQGSRISSPHELARVWQEFLHEKFSQTDLEQARDEFEALPESKDADAKLSREEFDEAVKQMKVNKATGMDKIPSEV